MITALLVVALVVVLGPFVLCVVNLRAYCRAAEGDVPEAQVDVCIPARNEAENLESVVRSLLAQGHVKTSVLVYDDQSTDATPAILARLSAEDPRVVAVPTAALPPGWNGKQWGCDRMGRAATGEWLLFTDADVRFEPECIARTLAEARRAEADLLSTFPRQRTGTPGEALLIPLIHFVLLSYLPLGRMRATADPATSAGCGQFLFVRRAAWLAAGGHAAFPDSMHDGIKLPRALRRAGFRTDLFDGTELVSCRMYRGFGATWRGFAKNAYEGLGSPLVLVVVTLLHLVGHVLPWAFLLWAAWTGEASALQWALAATAAALAIIQRLVLAGRFRQSVGSALLHPLGVFLMTAVQWWSAVLHASGTRSWRGRVHRL